MKWRLDDDEAETTKLNRNDEKKVAQRERERERELCGVPIATVLVVREGLERAVTLFEYRDSRFRKGAAERMVLSNG
ncbi:hypothetical protein VNO77_33567 [Canavalia gladiata]|uniref:Uncharacterized protein n=1 Tax=Canavalia gladiata TaxID=3824 RepID=A0AAN9PWH8_CANGL